MSATPEQITDQSDEQAADAAGAHQRVAPLQTLARGLRILRFVASSPTLVRLRDVAQAFDLERSIALRILQSLEVEGFVRKHQRLKAYSLGPAVSALLQPRSLIERLTERSRPAMEELMRVTGQTSHIGILEDGSAMLIGVCMARGPVAVQQAPGDIEALYCSAVGKAIYAFLPEVERHGIASRLTLTRHKPATLSSVEELEAQAAMIRQTGVAFDNNEGPAPLACIAVPVLDRHGLPIASVGISTIVALLDRPIQSKAAWIEAVRHCARKMEADLR